MSARGCQHIDFVAAVDVNRIEDTGRFSADIRITCSACGEPFRFLGTPAGVSFDRPMVSITGTELRAPIEPQGEPRLFASATFQVPALPGERES